MARKSIGAPEPVEDAPQQGDDQVVPDTGDLTVDGDATTEGKGGYLSGQGGPVQGGSTAGSGAAGT